MRRSSRPAQVMLPSFDDSDTLRPLVKQPASLDAKCVVVGSPADHLHHHHHHLEPNRGSTTLVVEVSFPLPPTPPGSPFSLDAATATTTANTQLLIQTECQGDLCSEGVPDRSSLCPPGTPTSEAATDDGSVRDDQSSTTVSSSLSGFVGVLRRGRCKWFNVAKGWGFISPLDEGPDVFVHQSVIKMAGFRSLGDDEEVEFECRASSKGFEATLVCGPGTGDCKGSHRRPMSKKKFRKVRCYNCGEFANHIAAKCREGPLPKRCHQCKSSGHLIADCPLRAVPAADDEPEAAGSPSSAATSSAVDRKSRAIGPGSDPVGHPANTEHSDSGLENQSSEEETEGKIAEDNHSSS